MIMLDGPKVSVIISAYNRPQWVGEALQSVFDSTYKNIEVLVRNSSSPEYFDDVEAAILRFPYVKYSRGINKNCPHSFNELFKQAVGEYVIHCNDDDAFTPDLIARMVAEMPYCTLCCVQPLFIDKDSQPFTSDHACHKVPKVINLPRE